jgi:hypothetical protein
MRLLASLPTESGLSECTHHPSAPACASLDSGLALWVVGLPTLVGWMLLAGIATASIAKAAPPWKAGWLTTVWCVPILGALAWLVWLLTGRRRTHAGDTARRPDDATG